MHRLKTRSQFQAVLQSGHVIGRSAHFALHRLPLAEGVPALATSVPAADSVGPGSATEQQARFLAAGPWLGAMVPKRWARQAVTRNLIKRQIYSAGQRHEHRFANAAHVLRLRSSFDRQQFRSPGSDVLREAVRDELDSLLLKASA